MGSLHSYCVLYTYCTRTVHMFYPDGLELSLFVIRSTHCTVQYVYVYAFIVKAQVNIYSTKVRKYVPSYESTKVLSYEDRIRIYCRCVSGAYT
jgi:hypothetical protein